MLLLSRKAGEAIYIGKDIRVVVKEIRGGRAMIGIVAPKDVLILREEIADELKREHPPEKLSIGWT